MLGCMGQGLMLEVAQSQGNEVKGIEVQENEGSVNNEVKRVGQSEYALNVVAGQKIQGVAFDLENVDFQEGIGENQSQNGKLAACLIVAPTLVAEIGLFQRHHADRADQQQRMGRDGIHVLKQIDGMMKAYHGISEKDKGTQKGRHGRDVVEVATLAHSGYDGQPTGNGAPGAGKEIVQNRMQVQSLAAREIDDATGNLK